MARDVSRDNKSNDWRRENGTLRTVGGRLYLPVENIPDEYDLRLRVERKSAGNALVIGLASSQRRVAFVMDGYASRGGMWGAGTHQW